MLQIAALALVVMAYFYLRNLEPSPSVPVPASELEELPQDRDYRADFTRRHRTLSASELERQVGHIERVAALAQQPPREVERILAQSDALAASRPLAVDDLFDERYVRRGTAERELEAVISREAWQLALRTFRPATIDVTCDQRVCRARFGLPRGMAAADAGVAAPLAALLVMFVPQGFDGLTQRDGRDERGAFVDAYLWRDVPAARRPR